MVPLQVAPPRAAALRALTFSTFSRSSVYDSCKWSFSSVGSLGTAPAVPAAVVVAVTFIGARPSRRFGICRKAASAGAGPPRRRSWRLFSEFLASCVVFLLLFLSLLGFRYAASHWNAWFEATIRNAFAAVDVDNSGSIDAKELYAGVLLLYVKMNWHVKVQSPPRDVVLEMMTLADIDKSNELDFSEFRQVAKMLADQVAGRALAQLAFTIVVPLLASFIVGKMVRQADACHARNTVEPSRGVQTTLLQRLRRRLPRTLPATLLSVVLMISSQQFVVPTIFDAIDGWATSQYRWR